MINTKFLVTSLLVSGVLSGAANAATSAASKTALVDLLAASSTGIDTAWVENNDWAGLDSNAASADGIAWGDPSSGGSDPCVENWAGIVCNGSDITHIELPNAKMASTLEQVFAAIAPIKAQLVSVNFSGTTGDKNTLTGGIPATADGQGYTSLKYLALNDVGATGGIPDLSSYTVLSYANFYDNDFTTYTGPIGGGVLGSLRLFGNANLTGDLAATIAAAPNLAVLRSDGTQLTGGLGAVTNVSVSAGVAAKSMTISWTAGGGASAHRVEYSSSDGASWVTESENASGNSVTTAPLANGTYGAKITPKSSAGFIGSPAYTTATLVISDSGSEAGTGSGAGQETGETGGSGSSGSSDSGSGAAFWLILLPLMGLFRRR